MSDPVTLLDEMMAEFLKTDHTGIQASSPPPTGYGPDLSKWPTTSQSGSYWRNGEVLRKQAIAEIKGTTPPPTPTPTPPVTPPPIVVVPPTPPPPPPPPTSHVSGIPMPKSPPAGWTNIVAEDFDKDVALGAWPASAGGALTKPPGYTDLGAYPAPWVNSAGGGLYDPSKVLSIHDSCLDTYLHSKYIGTVQPLIGGGHTRLRIQICSLIPVVAGYHVSHLLWPDDNNWPTNGEIDFPEGDMSSGLTCYCFVHLQNAKLPAGSPGWQADWNSGAVMCDGKWHVYTTEWEAGKYVTVQRDDTAPHTFMNSSSLQIPNTPMHYEHQTDHNSNGSLTSAGHIMTDWIYICK